MSGENPNTNKGGAVAIWVAVIGAISAITVAIIEKSEPPPSFQQIPPEIVYRWDEDTEEIFAIYGKGCQNHSQWSKTLTASEANLGKKVYIAASSHGDKMLLLKEGEPKSFPHGYGLGKQTRFSNEGKTIAWAGGRGHCGHDHPPVKVNATVYTCVKDVITHDPIPIEPIGFWKFWDDIKKAVFGVFSTL